MIDSFDNLDINSTNGDITITASGNISLNASNVVDISGTNGIEIEKYLHSSAFTANTIHFANALGRLEERAGVLEFSVKGTLNAAGASANPIKVGKLQPQFAGSGLVSPIAKIANIINGDIITAAGEIESDGSIYIYIPYGTTLNNGDSVKVYCTYLE